jgi:hypothetical protein
VERMASIRSRIGRIKMNRVRFKFHLAVVKFYISIMELLSEKCYKHNAKAEQILKESERK